MTVVSEPKRYCDSAAAPWPAMPDISTPARQPAVEQDRQPDVAGGLALLAQDLHRHRPATQTATAHGTGAWPVISARPTPAIAT